MNGVVALTDAADHAVFGSKAVSLGETARDFRPLVENNGAIGWTLLQTLAKRLPGAERTG